MSRCNCLFIFSEAQINKGLVGKVFKKDAKLITETLSKLSLDEISEMETKLNDTR